jgi:RNA polymerase sigma-70 factor (ECF subfamily)
VRLFFVSPATDRDTPDPAGGPAAASEGAEAGDLKALFRELAMGNLAALDRIYDAAATDIYRLALWRIGVPGDAEDVVQTVFVRLAEARARLAEVRDPKCFLLAMAHRAAVDRRRRAAARALPLPEDPDLLQAAREDPGRAIDARRASAALRRLPAAQREAIVLHHFSGLTFAAIGRVTGVPTFTAASRFRNGIKALRRLMGLTG